MAGPAAKQISISARRRLKSRTVLSQSIIRRPESFYLHLTLISPTTLDEGVSSHFSTRHAAQVTAVDPITARTFLTAALEQFLGLTGTAIPIDILKCHQRDVWIRVPNEDGSTVVKALSGWTAASSDVAWRIRCSGVWLGGVLLGGGDDLFTK